MKNITIAFLAAVSLMSFGCKKKGGDAMAKMGEYKDAMCKCTDKACAEKVTADMTKWASDQKEAPKMSESDNKAATDMAMKMAECQQKAMGAGAMEPAGGSGEPAGSAAAAGSAAPAAPAAAGDLPAECADYKAAMDKLATCDKLPQASRDAMKQSYEQTSAAWASIPAEGRAALGTACKAAADAVKQAMSAGCP